MDFGLVPNELGMVVVAQPDETKSLWVVQIYGRQI